MLKEKSLLFFSAGQEMKSRILVSVNPVNVSDVFAVMMFLTVFCLQVIKTAEDCARQYMNFMNVIFAAQKQVSHWNEPLFHCFYQRWHIHHTMFICMLFYSEYPHRRLRAWLRLRSSSAGMSSYLHSDCAKLDFLGLVARVCVLFCYSP